MGAPVWMIWVNSSRGGFGFALGGVGVCYMAQWMASKDLHGHSPLGGCGSEKCICRIAITPSQYIYRYSVHLMISPRASDVIQTRTSISASVPPAHSRLLEPLLTYPHAETTPIDHRPPTPKHRTKPTNPYPSTRTCVPSATCLLSVHLSRPLPAPYTMIRECRRIHTLELTDSLTD